jgi:sec-independent protein translocase protein TatB
MELYMFGMGFMEIFLIAMVAIIALGPDKLPTAMVEVAKFLKKFKSGVADAKSTLDNELNLSDLKEEANKFKAQIEDTKSSLSMNNKLDLGLDDIMNDNSDKKIDKDFEKKEEKVSFKKPKKKKKKEVAEIVEKVEVATTNDAANKFKVNFDDKKEDNA